MTTIAANLTMMAADSRVVHGDTHFPGQKLYRIPDGILGIAGSGKAMEQFLRWIMAGENPDKVPDAKDVDGSFSAMILRPGLLYVYLDDYWPEPVNRDYHAIGTGGGPALMALRLGHSPIEAVTLAWEVDSNSGGPAVAMQLGEVTAKRKRKS